MSTWIGRSVKRREDPHLLRGEGRYAADLALRGAVHLAFRRAGSPTGTGLRVDLAAARSMPGVVGAWTAAELGLAVGSMTERGLEVLGIRDGDRTVPVERPVLASDTVCFEGEAVAVVAAESAYQAADAVEAVVVELDDSQVTPHEVKTRHGFGDAEAAFREAALTVREELAMAASKEPRSSPEPASPTGARTSSGSRSGPASAGSTACATP